MTSQDTGGTGFPGARAAARSAGRVQSPRWLPASPGRNAPGWGATGGGSCVLHVGRAFVQYAQPLASRSPPSWSRPTRGRSPGRSRCCVGATGSRDRGQVGQKGPEVPGPTIKTPRSRSRQQPSVHSADTDGPDVELLELMVAEFPEFPVICEGRIHPPEHAEAVMAAGAWAAVVGTAVTHPTTITGWFDDSVRRGGERAKQ